MNDNIGFHKSGEADTEHSSSLVSLKTDFKTKCCSLYVWGYN